MLPAVVVVLYFRFVFVAVNAFVACFLWMHRYYLDTYIYTYSLYIINTHHQIKK